MSLLSPTRRSHQKPLERISVRKPAWLGVDVGTHSIKLAIVTHDRPGEWKLNYAQRIPWPSDAEPFASADQFGDALRDVLERSRSGWRTTNLTRAAFSLPKAAISSEDMQVDTDDPATVLTTAAQTMQQLYGSRSEKLAFDVWQPEPVDGGFADPPASQLLWAEPDVVTNSLAAFRACRLTADVLDTPPFTTARASEMMVDSSDSELMIDWGWTRLTLTWILNGRPRFTRFSIQGNVADLVQSVCDAQDLTPSSTELLLARYGLPGETISGFNRVIEKAATDSLQILLDEIDSTLTYLGSRYPRQPINRIILSGGGAAIRNLDQWLSSQIGIDAIQWALPSGVDRTLRQSLWPTPLFAQAAALSGLGCES